MNKYPRVYTERLMLRKLEPEDYTHLINLANNPKISDRIVNIPYPYREPDAAMRLSFVVRGYKDKTRIVFAIIRKESDEFLGEISLHLLDKSQRHGQLAYWLGEPYWNKGLVSEAAKAVMKFGFQYMSLDLIFANCNQDNLASERIMQKSGMLKQNPKDQFLLYAINKEEYKQIESQHDAKILVPEGFSF